MKAYTTTYDPQRPPLVRLDSKTNISPRLGGYPNQQGGTQFRPPQPRPQFAGNPQYGARPPLQRNPSSGQFNLPPNLGARPVSPNTNPGLRPVTPYPRPQQQSQPQQQQPLTSPRSPTSLFQQKPYSVPQTQFSKEQNLDTAVENAQNKDATEYTVQSSNIIEEEEPMSILDIPKQNDTGINQPNEMIENLNTIDNRDIQDENPPRPESRSQKIYDIEVTNRKPSMVPSTEDIPQIQDTVKNIPKPETLTAAPISQITSEKNILNDDKKKTERKSPSPEPPRTPRTQKMTLNLEEQNRPRSPRLPSGKSEDRSPTTPGRKPVVEKALKPEIKSSNKRNGLLKSLSRTGDFFFVGKNNIVLIFVFCLLLEIDKKLEILMLCLCFRRRQRQWCR